jgi:hypothetical protein
MRARWRVAGRAGILALLLAGAAACGGGTQPPLGAAPGAADQTTAPAAPQPERLGCSDYCQTAGGYGAAPSDLEAIVTVTTDGPVTVADDGTVGLRISCRVDVDCKGAILTLPVGSSAFDNGRCDLDVPAQGKRYLAVPLPPSVLQALGPGDSLEVGITLDASPAWQQLSKADQDASLGIFFGSIEVVGA